VEGRRGEKAGGDGEMGQAAEKHSGWADVMPSHQGEKVFYEAAI